MLKPRVVGPFSQILSHIMMKNNSHLRLTLYTCRYDVIMYKSWELRPEDRPSFDDLVHQLLEYWEEEHAYVIERSLNGL